MRPRHRLTAAVAGLAVVLTLAAGAPATAAGPPAGQAGSTAVAAASPNAGTLTGPVPTVSGSAVVGQKLTAKPGTWAPSGTVLTYQWKANGAAIAGATTAAYTVTSAVLGKKLTVTVTGKRTGYTTLARTSSASAAVARGTITGAVPTITGTATVGQKLTAKPGTWAPAGTTLSYQWKVNGTAVAGATGSTFTVRGSDAGKAVTVTVQGTRTGFTTLARTSRATTIAAPAPALVAYKNCDALNAVHPHGVAREGVKVNMVAGVGKPLGAKTVFSTALYNLNTGRDRDKDGIACEQG